MRSIIGRKVCECPCVVCLDPPQLQSTSSTRQLISILPLSIMAHLSISHAAIICSPFFTKLPLEIRLMIYEQVLQRPRVDEILQARFATFPSVYVPITGLTRRKVLLVCKKMYEEAWPTFLATAVLRVTVPEYGISPTFLKAPETHLSRIQILELMVESGDLRSLQSLRGLNCISKGKICHVRLGCGKICEMSLLYTYLMPRLHQLPSIWVPTIIDLERVSKYLLDALADIFCKFQAVVFTTGPIYQHHQGKSCRIRPGIPNLRTISTSAHHDLLQLVADETSRRLVDFEQPLWAPYHGVGEKVLTRFVMWRRGVTKHKA